MRTQPTDANPRELLDRITIHEKQNKIDTKGNKLLAYSGLQPAENDYHLQIKVDHTFGSLLQHLELEDYRSNLTDMIMENISNDFSNISYIKNTIFIRNLTIAPQATGVDYHGEDIYGNHLFSHHNIDTSHEAIEVIAVFEDWIEYSQTILSSISVNDGIHQRLTDHPDQPSQ